MNSQSKITEHINEFTISEIQQTKQIWLDSHCYRTIEKDCQISIFKIRQMLKTNRFERKPHRVRKILNRCWNKKNKWIDLNILEEVYWSPS